MRRPPFSFLVGLFCIAQHFQAQPQPPYQAAVAYVQQGRNDLAIPLLERLLAGAPTDLKARNLLGIALLNSGRREEAGVQFRKAIDTDATFYPALKNLALNELALGRRAAARSHFEQVLKLAPNDPVSHFSLGELDYTDKRYAQAVTHYQRSGGLYLKDNQAAVRALRACVNSSNPAAAIQIGEQLSATAEVLSLLAQAYEQSGDTQRAYDALRSATRLEPRNEGNYLDLMSLCLTHHTWDLAMEISEVALNQMPQSWRVRLQRGAVLALKGEVEAAEKEFLQATRVAPRETLPQVALGLARVQLNRIPEAIQVLRSCRAEHPRDYVTNWILGETLAQQGDRENEAVTVLEEAARLGPREAAPKALLGKLLARRGDLAGAARELEAALRIEPDDVTAQYQLATVYRKTGNTARADQLFEKVGKARPEDPEQSAKHNLEQIIRKSSR
jgi:tetratricopeptide (TPR) repeat protein